MTRRQNSSLDPIASDGPGARSTHSPRCRGSVEKGRGSSNASSSFCNRLCSVSFCPGNSVSFCPAKMYQRFKIEEWGGVIGAEFSNVLIDCVHRLAAEQPFEIAHPLFQPAQFGSRHHVVIGADGVTAAFAHQP